MSAFDPKRTFDGLVFNRSCDFNPSHQITGNVLEDSSSYFNCLEIVLDDNLGKFLPITDSSTTPSMESRYRLNLKSVLWVTIVAIILWLTPMVLAQSTDEEMEVAPFSRPAGEAVDFSQEDGDGIIEPGEIPQEELAKAAQNPVASMISLPFQNNTNFGVGPDDKVQNVLNIQPVWPFALTDDINLITRTIAPIVSQPGIRPGEDRTNGLGNINFTAFLWFCRK